LRCAAFVLSGRRFDAALVVGEGERLFWIEASGLPRRFASDGTTGETTSHLTGETTSHSTKPPKYGGKVAGYKAASCQVIGYGYSHPTDGTTKY